MSKTLPHIVTIDDMKLAMERADVAEIVEIADELGRQAVEVALATPERPPVPKPDLAEEDRQRALDAAFGDVIEVVNRHRLRLGRRVCSMSDARVTRQMFELVRSMAGPDGGADNDPSFN